MHVLLGVAVRSYIHALIVFLICAVLELALQGVDGLLRLGLALDERANTVSVEVDDARVP